MYFGIIASLLASALAGLLAREASLRRALEALCAQLIKRVQHDAHQRRTGKTRSARF